MHQILLGGFAKPMVGGQSDRIFMLFGLRRRGNNREALADNSINAQAVTFTLS